VVDAIIRLSQDEKTIGEVFNIGGIEEITINELAKRVIGLTHSESIIDYVSYNDAYASGYEDMERRVPDITKIKNFIGWSPKINLDQIILDVAKFENQRNLGQP
jgi:UDP-glucose 4-epimerase